MSKTRSVFTRIAEAIEAQNSLLEEVASALDFIAFGMSGIQNSVAELNRSVASIKSSVDEVSKQLTLLRDSFIRDAKNEKLAEISSLISAIKNEGLKMRAM
jgi:methyl-accepting chemotaxis protein